MAKKKKATKKARKAGGRKKATRKTGGRKKATRKAAKKRGKRRAKKA